MVKQALACLLVVCCFCSTASASTVVWPDTTGLVYFYSPACDLCDDAALLLSNLESESNITILRYDLTEVESLALMKTLLEEKNLEPELAGAAPAVFSQQGYIIGPFDEGVNSWPCVIIADKDGLVVEKMVLSLGSGRIDGSRFAYPSETVEGVLARLPR